MCTSGGDWANSNHLNLYSGENSFAFRSDLADFGLISNFVTWKNGNMVFRAYAYVFLNPV